VTLQRRCAIYTRKSTEEGLEQGFNSLHAQREACEAFIRSQRHEGWRALPDAFDDGGYSGGTMERPALARLLESIRARQVDVVVVYKVDRLTRSLADFAKMVEKFDASGVSFVSVTQQFNTTTSMGRLTLNVLLSFAQFEREVTGERIRDKIAASKQKGIWMGGLPPLGYDVQDWALVINPGEADRVRTLFRLYGELGTVRRLKEAADRLGLRTKRRISSQQMIGWRPFSRGQLYRLLSNRLYVGEVSHRGCFYPGRHGAIIDRTSFDSVQKQLAQNAAERHSRRNAREPSLLSGLVYDETGDRLSPTHTNKKGRRYRYYVSTRLLNRASNGGWRLPARELEIAVVRALQDYLRDSIRLSQTLELDQLPPERLREIIGAAKARADELDRSGTERQDELLTALIKSVRLHPDAIRIELKRTGLAAMIADLDASAPLAGGLVAISLSARLKRRGVEAKLMLQSGTGLRSYADQTLIRTIAEARLWIEELAAGRAPSIRALARRYGRDPGEVCRTLRLAFLAPDIVHAILEGCQPIELTPRTLKRIRVLPHRWDDQSGCLGFQRSGTRTRRVLT
jgi:site-specific DNA recombinase